MGTESNDFFWRRLHSLTGLWLVLFIIEHLLTNSQSALLLGDDGSGFIRSVNFIHNLPYLPVIELFLLGVPFLIHGLWGIRYAMKSRINSVKNGENNPYLPYSRNRAFTWQRITSWILLVGVILHVYNMRFLHYPEHAEGEYLVKITEDAGLPTLAARLGVTLYNQEKIDGYLVAAHFAVEPKDPVAKQAMEQKKEFGGELSEFSLKKGEILAAAPNFGTASLLAVRNTFKQPLMIILYSLFVLAAGYHAFNGLWTAFITWGINVKASTQARFLTITWGLTAIVTCLGLASVWLTYYNLRQ